MLAEVGEHGDWSTRVQPGEHDAVMRIQLLRGSVAVDLNETLMQKIGALQFNITRQIL